MWRILEKLGCKDSIFIEEEEETQLHCLGPAGILPEGRLSGLQESAAGESEVDWDQEWSKHSPGEFKDGVWYLSFLGKELRMKSGPGFGDLSHETTRLCLHLLEGISGGSFEGKTVLDLGCGSGVLSIAAALAGAKQIVGVDIDPAALRHSEENAKLNQLAAHTEFLLPEDLVAVPKGPVILLVNMTFGDQKKAWKALPQPWKEAIDICIASGILKEQEKAYETFLAADSLSTPINKIYDGVWLGLIVA